MIYGKSPKWDMGLADADTATDDLLVVSSDDYKSLHADLDQGLVLIGDEHDIMCAKIPPIDQSSPGSA